MDNGIVEKLKKKIGVHTPLGEIVEAFCGECNADLPEKDFLFETGLYQFTCEEEYYFSLAVQYKGDGDEYMQLRCDIVYPPSVKYENFSSCEWRESLTEFKDAVLNSKEFEILKDESIFKIDIYLEKT